MDTNQGAGEFYDFETKYLAHDAVQMVCPAQIPDAARDLIRATAAKAFTALDCEGLTRVDFFLTERRPGNRQRSKHHARLYPLLHVPLHVAGSRGGLHQSGKRADRPSFGPSAKRQPLSQQGRATHGHTHGRTAKRS